MNIRFREVKLSSANRARLGMINRIISEYQDQGYRLTLRQLYYQLVSREVIPNNTKEYSKLSILLKEGRMGGVVDWNAIEDRLRVPSKPPAFDSPTDVLDAAINQYELPRMEGQDTYVEVWVEKDALSGVLKRVTEPFHIPIVVNRGYSSASAMYDAFNRFKKAHENNQQIKILYLGDFDPSGVDMIRDIRSRILEFFIGYYQLNQDEYGEPNDLSEDDWSAAADSIGLAFKVIPVALTREQIRLHRPPPNPAKKTDPRSKDFIKLHGSSSWEVDALKPEVLNDLLTLAIKESIDLKLYEKILKNEKKDIKKLESLKQYL